MMTPRPAETVARESEVLHELETHIPNISQKTRTQLATLPNAWQPADYLPDFSREDTLQADIRHLQAQTRNLRPELLVALIGDTLTEEGLPTFTSSLFTTKGLPTGEADDAFTHKGNLQRWFRQWTAEEHRHGVLLQNFLRLSGRVNMRAYEQSVQLFLEDGMDLGIQNSPFRGFVYTSFQELATQRSHMNVAKLAKEQGSPLTAKICGQIASDEAYHAKAYAEFVRFFFEREPNGMMQALAEMMRHGITMPAHMMREVDPNGNVLQPGETYAFFSDLAQHLGVYTSRDYAEISANLLETWQVGERKGNDWQALPMAGLGEEGLAAQHDVLRRQTVIEKRVQRQKPVPVPQHEWSWLVENARK